MSRLLPSLPDVSPEDREPRVVDVDDDDANDLIDALSSETARGVLSALHEEPATTSELAERLDTTLQNTQYHLRNLREAELVEVVETVYSEKGREMNVYAPADEPLVLFAGNSTESGVKTALKRLLSGYGLLGLAALAAHRVLRLPGVGLLGGSDDGSAEAGDTGDMTVQEESATETPTTADTAEAAASDGYTALTDAAVDVVGSLSDPGVVFFLGAALAFTVAWLYWYRSTWRRVS